MHLKMSSAKTRQFCLGVDELRTHRMMKHMKYIADRYINAKSLSQSGNTIDGSNSVYDEEHNTDLLTFMQIYFQYHKGTRLSQRFRESPTVHLHVCLCNHNDKNG